MQTLVFNNQTLVHRSFLLIHLYKHKKSTHKNEKNSHSQFSQKAAHSFIAFVSEATVFQQLFFCV